MNVIVVAAGGFVGTNLVKGLASIEGIQLTLVDSDLAYLENALSFAPNAKAIVSPFDDNTDFHRLVKGADLVFHLFSSNIPASQQTGIKADLRRNVEWTASLLDACVAEKVKKVAFISSGGTVYGIVDHCPIPEDAPTSPITSYGFQKLAIEKMLYLYKRIYRLDFCALRLSNPFGPFQRPNGVQGAMTTFIYRTLKGEELTVYGDGSVVRDYIYIDDAIAAVIKVALSKSKHDTYNIGSGKGLSLNDIIAMVGNTLKKTPVVSYLPSRPVDVPTNYLNVSRYEEEFGPICKTSIEQGIQATAYFLANK